MGQAARIVGRFRATVIELPAKAKADLGMLIFDYISGASPIVTPVDTGWARSNWRLSIGAPDKSLTPKPSKPARSPVPGKAWTPHGRFGGAGPMLGPPSRPRILRVPEGVPVYISNATPYIGKLNQGWSKQAPAKFVQRAVQWVFALYVHTKNSVAAP